MGTTKVALLGLGTMGSGMATNLLKAGHTLTVFNRTYAKAQSFAEQGGTVAQTPGAAVKDADIVIAMLADDAASREAWIGSQSGENGALSAVKPGAILVESSTVSPAWITELSALAAEHKAELLDAPVTGSRTQAEAGQLTFLVGGSESALRTATPVLQSMSKDIIHLGPLGSGAKLKLVNNFLCGVQVASLAEAIAWIERSGLDREKALAILKSGAPGSPLLSAISQRMVSRDYNVNFLLRLMSKDLLYATQEAQACDVDLTTATAARSLFQAAIAEGLGDNDMSAVIEPLRIPQAT